MKIVRKKEDVKEYPVFVKKDDDQGGRHAYKVSDKEELEIYAKDNNIPIMMKDGIEYLCNYIKENNIKELLPDGDAIYDEVLEINLSKLFLPFFNTSSPASKSNKDSSIAFT